MLKYIKLHTFEYINIYQFLKGAFKDCPEIAINNNGHN